MAGPVASHARTCAQVLARLVLDHPGVRHRCVADAAEAADHVSQLTKALATQPFKVQVRFQAPPCCSNLLQRSLRQAVSYCKEWQSAYGGACSRTLYEIIYLPVIGRLQTQIML